MIVGWILATVTVTARRCAALSSAASGVARMAAVASAALYSCKAALVRSSRRQGGKVATAVATAVVTCRSTSPPAAARRCCFAAGGKAAKSRSVSKTRFTAVAISAGGVGSNAFTAAPVASRRPRFTSFVEATSRSALVRTVTNRSDSIVCRTASKAPGSAARHILTATSSHVVYRLAPIKAATSDANRQSGIGILGCGVNRAHRAKLGRALYTRVYVRELK